VQGPLQVQVGGGGGGCVALLREPMDLGAVFESDEGGGGDRLRLFVLESRVSFVVVQMSLSDRGGDRVDKIVLGICAMDKKTVWHACGIALPFVERAQSILVAHGCTRKC